MSILIGGVLFRVVFGEIYFNFKSSNYGEYGVIGKNITDGKGYSLFYVQNDTLKTRPVELSVPYPSALTGPLYTYYIAALISIDETELRNAAFFLINTIIFLLTAYLILIRFKKDRIYLICALALLSFIPDFVYAVIFPSPSVFIHLLVALTLILLAVPLEELSVQRILAAGIVLGFICLMNSMYLPLAIAITIYLYFRLNDKRLAFIIPVAVFLAVSPWLMRNILILGDFEITSGFWSNFYRSNFEIPAGVMWYNIANIDLNAISGKNLEILLDTSFRSLSIDKILSEPISFIAGLFAKIFHITVYDPNTKISYNPLFMIPSLCFNALAIWGILLKRKGLKIDLYLLIAGIFVLIFMHINIAQVLTVKILGLPFAAAALKELLLKSGLYKPEPYHSY
ncbi:MAG: glycosyltransferase family 39 protein [Ignavibacteriaceae bacterium]|nr:glycosyltransferase family 39 protein [Ignavibacteriaceae bacterium]